MILTVPLRIEAPDQATHYSGDPTVRGGATWWKLHVNSTGVVRVWCYYCEDRCRWFIQGEHQPHWINPIPEEWRAQ